MSSWKRTGWIDQLSIEKDDWGPGDAQAHFHSADAIDRWFDRFSCHWQEPSDSFLRIRYGPACVELADAIAWCERHCDHAFVDAFGDRWSTGAPREGFSRLPPLADRIAQEAERWSDAPTEEWRVEVALNLGPGDYAAAAPIFERSLRALAEVDSCSLDWTGARLSARIRVLAPALDLARELARHLARQAASDLTDGLRDETGEVFGASVNQLGDAPRGR
ncbi:MAG: hypothetical protein QOD61_691 [Solirubrobacteraceae bacterium]|nr:hypothetical protein [Solirubrobacteraceae bacterium]